MFDSTKAVGSFSLRRHTVPVRQTFRQTILNFHFFSFSLSVLNCATNNQHYVQLNRESVEWEELRITEH